MESHKRNVVVLGASMAGLFAARVLSDHAGTVTLVERDRIGPDDEARKGVPQGRHAHGLLARGQLIAESLFPGLGAELREAGAVCNDLGSQRWYLGGQLLAVQPATGVTGFTCPRPLLEGRVRARVRALSNVVVRDETDIVGLVAEGDRVVGARILPRADGAAEEVLDADLVVDATGRGSRLPSWLTAMGFDPAEEERVRVGVQYSTVIARRRPEHAHGSGCVVVAAAPPNRRCGVALAIDAERWIITLPGYLGESAGRSWESMVDFARGLPAGELAELMQDSEPLSDVVTASFPHSLRRRYDLLGRHPEGVVAFGDSICSFNPIFGQGMTVAACEAIELGRIAGKRPLPVLWRPFYRATQPIVDVPWSMAVGNDLRFEEVAGRRTSSGRLLARYLDRVFDVAASDRVVGEQFLRVAHLLDAPPSLMSPRVLLRVARGRTAPMPAAPLPANVV